MTKMNKKTYIGYAAMTEFLFQESEKTQAGNKEDWTYLPMRAILIFSCIRKNERISIKIDIHPCG